MTELEQKAMLDSMTEQVKKTMSQYATQSDIEKAVKLETESLKEQFKGVSGIEKKVAEIEKAAITQGEVLAKLKNTPTNEPLSVKAQLESQIETLQKIQANHKQNYQSFKTIVLPTSITTNFNGQVVPGVGQYPQRNAKLTNVCANGALSPNHQRTIRYMDTTTYTNNAAARTVGDAAAESAIAWTGRSLPIESISTFIPVALEMLSDFDFVESEINITLMNMLINKFEYYIMSGNGTPPQITGIDNKATAFTAATNFSGAFKYATTLDLIMAMAAQIGNNSNYSPNYCLMNNYDALKLQLEKDELGRLVYPNFISQDGMKIGNITVIPTELVTADTMYVGDFNYATLYKTAPQVTMGLNATDFTERQVTLLANMDAALLIRTMFTGSIYKCAGIAADVQTITAV